MVFLTFNKHSKAREYSYQSQIWADKAGYYIYLPAFFKYEFDGRLLHSDIEKKTGFGFSVDDSTGTIHTKYTCGVALLQLPWYLAADLTARLFDFKPDGFSSPYRWAIDISSIFCLVLGLYFLDRVVTIIGISAYGRLASLFILAGTNLYYYAVTDSGMSHVYSFFLFSAFLYLIYHTQFMQQNGLLNCFLLGIMCGMIILIRPTNVIFLSSYLFLGIQKPEDIAARFHRFMKIRLLAPTIIGCLIAVLPQLIYWKIISGHWVSYSYGQESFMWSKPQFMQVLLAPKNGLLPYSPLFILIFWSFLTQKNSSRVFFICVFIVITYLFSCWWDPSFGCSLGARSYVEYLALFALPFASLFENLQFHSKVTRVVVLLFVLMSVGVNLKITYSYDGCFPGTWEWDWDAYVRLLLSPTK